MAWLGYFVPAEDICKEAPFPKDSLAQQDPLADARLNSLTCVRLLWCGLGLPASLTTSNVSDGASGAYAWVESPRRRKRTFTPADSGFHYKERAPLRLVSDPHEKSNISTAQTQGNRIWNSSSK
jgi:hypothetical protein